MHILIIIINKMKEIPIYCISDVFLNFDEFCESFYEVIYLELAENGADRELDYDPEKEFKTRYKMYLDNNLK